MKRFSSLLRFASHYNDDVWGQIFRYNKSVKAFKYIAYSSSMRLKRRFQRVFNVNPNYYFNRVRRFSPVGIPRKVNIFGRILHERSKLQYFYGKLSKRQFKRKLWGSKGKTAYSRVDYLFARFECRLDLLLFRAGWFTETLTPFQFVYHGFVSLNGRKSSSPFERAEVGQFVTLSESVFNRRSILRRIRLRRFVFPSPHIFVSEYLPLLLIFKNFKVSYIKIFPNTNKFRILRYSYLFNVDVCHNLLYCVAIVPSFVRKTSVFVSR